MRHLVLADGDKGGLVDEDVSGLDQRVAEESIGAQVFVLEVLLLLLIAGDALQPAN
jgi:hypothetical protein